MNKNFSIMMKQMIHTLQTENKSETIKDSHVSHSFNDFLLKSELLRAIVDYGYEYPSEGFI
jgi:superfamily II DNA/RNA helicase